MKTPSFQLADGIFPNKGAFIAVSVPPAWLTQKAFENHRDLEPIFYIDLHDLIQKRIVDGRSPLHHPNASQAKSNIALLRNYADLLEKTFVVSADAVDEDEDGEEVLINSEKPDARIYLTRAETGNLTGKWDLLPCSKGHTDLSAQNSVVRCEVCNEQVTGGWTKEAIFFWNLERASDQHTNLPIRWW
ncbi:hypothetical protein [Pseudomonas sp. PS02303]|uniref:hypothetical protein n=1 Tax=Pseudomonas sp. PS02303 TaxID=2991429 RepID=UPI00249A95F7|nr:hypothetical protein [Pseudomonas sp. PS02303]